MNGLKGIGATRSNRRALVGGVAASGVGLALGTQLASASPAGNRGSVGFALQGAGNVPTPREQTLVIEAETSNVWDSFNAFIPNGDAYNYGISQLARENLFYVNFVTGEIKPWLAEKFEYNADLTEVTLHLNPKVTWSDGTPWTSADVVFSQQMLMKNPQLNGAAAVIDQVKDVKATDDHTVVWTLNAANPRFHYRFYAGVIADGVQVVPKHVWEKEDPGTFKDNPPIRTGPYTLKESSSSKLYYLWEKSPTYWAKDEMDPAPQYVMYVQTTSPDTSVQEFLAGATDVANVDFLNQQVIMGQTKNAAQNLFADPCPRGFYFNEAAPSGIFANADAKWAFSHLLDRETIAKTISQPASRPAHYPWADYDGWKKWAPDSVLDKFDWSFDPEKAKALLDGIGAKDDGGTRSFNGKKLELVMICPMPTNNPMYQIGDTLVAEAAKVGITISQKSLPGSAYWDSLALGDFDIANHWLCGMDYDPINIYNGFSSKNFEPIGTRVTQGGDIGPARVQNKDFDDVLAQLQEIGPDDPKAQALYDKALEIWATNLFSMPSIEQLAPFLYNTTYWTNWPPTENPATIPANWWGGFLFTIGNLKKAS